MGWTGPKPGTHDYLMQELHKPRKAVKLQVALLKAELKLERDF